MSPLSARPKRSCYIAVTCGTGQCKTQTADCRLQTEDKLQTEGKITSREVMCVREANDLRIASFPEISSRLFIRC